MSHFLLIYRGFTPYITSQGLKYWHKGSSPSEDEDEVINDSKEKKKKGREEEGDK